MIPRKLPKGICKVKPGTAEHNFPDLNQIIVRACIGLQPDGPDRRAPKQSAHFNDRRRLLVEHCAAMNGNNTPVFFCSPSAMFFQHTPLLLPRLCGCCDTEVKLCLPGAKERCNGFHSDTAHRRGMMPVAPAPCSSRESVSSAPPIRVGPATTRQYRISDETRLHSPEHFMPVCESVHED